MSIENKTKLENDRSITEAYEAGKRAGLIDGYLRATKSIETVIPQLQAMFIEKINLTGKLDKEKL